MTEFTKVSSLHGQLCLETAVFYVLTFHGGFVDILLSCLVLFWRQRGKLGSSPPAEEVLFPMGTQQAMMRPPRPLQRSGPFTQCRRHSSGDGRSCQRSQAACRTTPISQWNKSRASRLRSLRGLGQFNTLCVCWRRNSSRHGNLRQQRDFGQAGGLVHCSAPSCSPHIYSILDD